MTIIQAVLLGILQGATEFIPVSSSGHLVLIPWLLGWESPGLTLTVAVHAGTALAVLLYFWRDWLDMAQGALNWLRTRDSGTPAFRLLLLILLGSLPAAVVGGLFEDFFASVFERPLIAALMLMVTAAILIVGERLGGLTRQVGDLTWADSLFIGFAQALAIFPGVSRSGATIAAGRLRDMKRADAARFSFLLATPVIVGAGLLQLVKLIGAGVGSSETLMLLAGFVAALLTGYLVIRWLLHFLRTRSTLVFAVYCVLASAFSLAIFVIRGG